MAFLKKFINDEEGQDMVEYALLLGFISIAAILVVGAIGTKVNTVFHKTDTALATAT